MADIASRPVSPKPWGIIATVLWALLALFFWGIAERTDPFRSAVPIDPDQLFRLIPISRSD
jgi:hypothetical protein